jgi:diguanylate cyclase (GGDEF)-like protein
MVDRDTPATGVDFDDHFDRVTHAVSLRRRVHIIRGAAEPMGIDDEDVVITIDKDGSTLDVVGIGRIALAETAHVILSTGEGAEDLLEDNERLKIQLNIAATALGDCLTEIASLRAENTRLRDEALIDPLTKLGSERALEERFDRLNDAIRRDQAPVQLDKPKRPPFRLTFAYLDFDGFGDINTAIGHPTADRLLVKLGARLKASIRPGDDAYRKGGDEAIVLMIDKALRTQKRREEFKVRIDAAGKDAFEELIAELEEEGRHEEVANLRRIALVGYSVGIAVYNRKKHRTVQAVAQDADNDLFDTKEKRKLAVGIDPAARTNVLPSNPMIGATHARTHQT